ncbi:lipoxygenase homology domain-containing 1-like [Brachionus plicatilis]|uniref:Lipoxygenase homology domain-containing 1-like n=1 Tax=Brachionus plicatilis TaxID=10195 RepID=A0A3M7Q1T5_BRAPC|nr:lipoxygenase homology domain-containing 1-like [Brachionus plicatilis]
MQDNHRLIKDVSNALNYYIDRTRKEEGFDLSGILTPAYDLNQFKLKKLFGYSLAYDEQVKKLMQNEYKTPKIGSAKTDDLRLRERFYRDEIRYHCKWNRVRKIHSKSPTRNARPRDYNEASQYEKRNKSIATVPAGIVTVRNKNTPYLSKREKISMLNLTSKIMSATSEFCFPKEDIILMRNLTKTKENGPRTVCYARKSLAKSRRLERDRYIIEEEEKKQREAREQEMKRRREFEEELIRLKDEQDDDSRSLEDEVDELRRKLAPSKLSDNQDEKQNAWLDDLKELDSGDLISYQIMVKTGDRTGSSTEANIGIVLFGEKAKSKYFALKRSKRHRIPFRKSNLDIFEIETYDVGQLRAIQIGHFESDIEYNWFMDFLRVEDRTNNISYNFECDDWFGNSSKDSKSTRILYRKNYTQISSDIIERESLEKSSRSSSSSSASSQNRSIHSKDSSRPQSKRSSKVDPQLPVITTNSNANSPRSSTASIKKKISSRSSTSTSSSSSNSSSASEKSKSSQISSSGDKQDQMASPEEQKLSVRAVSSAKPKMNSIEAVEKNSLQDLKEIIAEAPTEINRTDSKGKSLLAIACENGFEEIVKYLVNNNDSLINEENVFGYLPVHSCARYNHLQCLKILYDCGASLQIKTNEGQTPLHLAAMWGHIEIVEWLCDHKVNLSILDSSECTAYDLAVKSGHERAANFLANLMGKPLIDFGNKQTDEKIELGRQSQKSQSSSHSKKKRSSSSSSTSSSSSNSSRLKRGEPVMQLGPRSNSNTKSNKSHESESDSEKEKPNLSKKLNLPSIKNPSPREADLKSRSPPNTPIKSPDRLSNSAKEKLSSNSFSAPPNTTKDNSEKETSPVPSKKSLASLRESGNKQTDEKIESGRQSQKSQSSSHSKKKRSSSSSSTSSSSSSTSSSSSSTSSSSSNSSRLKRGEPVMQSGSSPVPSKKSLASLRERYNSPVKAERISTPTKKSSSSRVQSRTSQNLEETKELELSRKSSTSSSRSLKKERNNSGRKSQIGNDEQRDNPNAPFEDTKKTIDDLFE